MTCEFLSYDFLDMICDMNEFKSYVTAVNMNIEYTKNFQLFGSMYRVR